MHHHHHPSVCLPVNVCVNHQHHHNTPPDVFNPKHKSASMRERMSDGHPEAPLLVYVGRLGAEKNTEALKDILQQVVGLVVHL